MSELFTVRLSTGHEQRYTLDELDTAYKGGFIDEKTLVKPAASARWMTLGELAGIEEEASPPSIAPMAIDAPVDVQVALDAGALASSEIPAELRPRKKGRIFAVGIAVVAVIGLGVAATRGASTIASAASSLKSKIVTTSADAPKAAAAMAPTPTPEAPKPTERQGTTTTTPPASAPSTITTDKLPNAAPQVKGNVPTMSAASLPDAKDKKKSAPAKTRTRK